MKVLFISSGKSGSVSEVVRNQGESLKAAGINVEYFLIMPGFFGYLFSILKIRRTYKLGNYDLAHAHYSLSGFASALAACSPLVVSLMGSDALNSKYMRLVIRFFYKFKWDVTIVKTQQMQELLAANKAKVIPNGVDIKRFRPIPKSNAREYVGYSQNKKIILFLSNPKRPEKNIELTKAALAQLKTNNYELKQIYNVPNNEIPYYLNASDVLLLTSKWEGSVNVIKEAMACNCPVISTNVGDVNWILGNTEGCFITSFEPHDVAEKIQTALDFGERTQGRKRIIDLELDSKTTAVKIIQVYKKVLLEGKVGK